LRVHSGHRRRPRRDHAAISCRRHEDRRGPRDQTRRISRRAHPCRRPGARTALAREAGRRGRRRRQRLPERDLPHRRRSPRSRAAGARVVPVDGFWSEAELPLKVKEPIAAEYARLRPGLVLFTYLHLAADEPLTRALAESGVAAVAYETVELDNGRLPLLAPMSEVAGRLATQMGAWALEKSQGGRGILLGGVPGVPPAKVVVLGGGIGGYNAALV